MTDVIQSIEQNYAKWLLSMAIRNGDCIECHFRPNDEGYCYTIGGESAHRFMWRTKNGPTNGLFVLHKCDNRKCMNVDHLFLGTQKDNVDDAVAKGRHKSSKPRILAPNQEAELWQLRQEGMSDRELSIKFGITKRVVYDYLRRIREQNAREVR